ncbi:MAG: Stk1 family PASTA domain-containing Ser/Thr kinase [Pseudonocardia sp.]|nr:Stk1 family PASTA domain-containing Ser/Thr kinase [Pseudonocardia sp.]
MTTPRLLSERYELGGTLGYGGMSEVHRGLDTRLGRDVAIKVLRADLARDPQFQMRFRREAQNAAALNHPAIVAVYDTGEVQSETGPLPYIVMEFVDGQTLREIVNTTGPIPQQRVIEVMADVCAALDFSHRHQIIHRDVKPANIMINHAGAVKVMDFGIARALGEGQNVTQTAAVIGTAQYLSPEQARGEAVDARSDVYAAGCVLFELLTGDPPFTGDTPVAVAYQHVREDPRRPSELNPAIPPSLDAVVLKALSKNPANRYQSAGEMRSDLVRVRSGQAPMAPTVMGEDERTAMLAAQTGPTRRINGGRHNLPPAPSDGYYDDDEPPRRNTGKIVAIAAGVIAALAVVAFVAFQIFGTSPPPPQATVPPMEGQESQAAQNLLASLSLRPNVTNENSDTVEQGFVIRSDPDSGEVLQLGSQVTLFVSSGRAEQRVAALANLTREQAQSTLEEQGLVLGPVTEQETADPAQVGRVISSNPQGGQLVPAGTAVAIVVGIEQQTVGVPQVGQDAGQARATLEDAGFDVDETEVDGPPEQGRVLGTSPAAGQQVEPGSRVTLQISRGNQLQVPDLLGLDRGDAVNELRDAGFDVDDVRFQQRSVSDSGQDNEVIEQSVDAGQSLEDGDELVVTIGDAGGGDN